MNTYSFQHLIDYLLANIENSLFALSSGDRYGARYMAFFTPVQSGLHTFFIRADNWAALYMSNGSNISEIQL